MLAAADLVAALSAIGAINLVGPTNLAAVACAAVLAPLWVAVAKAHGLYDFDHARVRHLTTDELVTVGHVAVISVALVATLVAVVPDASLPAWAFVLMASLAYVLDLCLRGAARALWRNVVPPERALVIGGGDLAQDVRRKLSLERGHHLVIAGSTELSSSASAEALAERLVKQQIDRVIVASGELDESTLATIASTCRRQGVKLSVTPPMRAMLGTAVSLTHLAELPIIEFRTWDSSRSTMALKRSFDIAVSGVLLVLTAPLLLMLALCVKLESRGPAFFVQTRAGINGAPFRMLKFRTMVPDAEQRLVELVELDSLAEPMFKLRGDPRVTRVGRYLRRTSLDELPQLINVLRGQMSMVGPRPEEMRLVERYCEEERFRVSMRPGLTGPMQVHGRGELSFSERLAIEREYVENYSFGRDVTILARTLATVVRGDGAF